MCLDDLIKYTLKIIEIVSGFFEICLIFVFIYFITYALYKNCRKNEKWAKHKFLAKHNCKSDVEKWKCLLIAGPWGSGKTYYYEKHYKHKYNKPNIYISCFSSSRSEIIAQTINQQLCLRIFTLNGLLAKLMESNWQFFMPKNKVIVFDDLERLHNSKNDYLDVIAVIDNLKKNNERIILLCNLEIISGKSGEILNSYLERVVDEVIYPPIMSLSEFQNDLLIKSDKNTRQKPGSKSESDQNIQQILKYSHELYTTGKLNNLRTLKTIIPQLNEQLQKNYSKFDEVNQVITASKSELIKSMNKYYLFYHNNKLFNDICNHINAEKTDKSIFQKTIKKIASNSQESVVDKYNRTIQKNLNTYQLDLFTEDFKINDYETWRDNGKALEPNISNFLFNEIRLYVESYENNEKDLENIYKLIDKYLIKFDTGNTHNKYTDHSILMAIFLIKYSEVSNIFQNFDASYETRLIFKIYEKFGTSWCNNSSFNGVFKYISEDIFIQLFKNKHPNIKVIYNEMFPKFEIECYNKLACELLRVNDFTHVTSDWFLQGMYNREQYGKLSEHTPLDLYPELKNAIKIIIAHCNQENIKILSASNIQAYNDIFIAKLLQTLITKSSMSASGILNLDGFHQDTIKKVEYIINFNKSIFITYCKEMKAKLKLSSAIEIFTKSSSNLSDEDAKKILYNLDITNELD